MAVFTREFELEKANILLKFEQSIEGDVSCVVWDAALVLSSYLDCENERSNDFLYQKTVIEFGSGIGCVGIAAASLGARVTATDLPKVLPSLQRSLELNSGVVRRGGGTIRARALDWSEGRRRRHLDGLASPDLLLLADCVYYKNSVSPLLDVMCSLCAPHTRVLLCQEVRDTERQRLFWHQFTERFGQLFEYKPVPRDKQHPTFYSPEPDIVLWEAVKKSYAV